MILQNINISLKTQKLKNSKTQKLKNSKTQKLKNSKTQKLKNSKTQKLKNSKLHTILIKRLLDDQFIHVFPALGVGLGLCEFQVKSHHALEVMLASK